jgi:ABC-type lipoprotein export system ATPase subunit
MKKITRLHLKNFKAFRDQVFDFDGKNVLLYGNNGSGKSSLFWAIYTFLQSSSKTNPEIQKYFKHFNASDPTTFESLKNVFASQPEDAFVKMNWADVVANTEGENTISASLMNTNWPADNPVAIANLGSDFINYKLLHNFFQATHKEEIKLWEVFKRDIFPFFQPNGRSEDFLKLIERLKEPRTQTGKVASGREKQRFIDEIEFINNEIDTFLVGIVDQANLLLSSAFSEGGKRIEIDLDYSKVVNERLNFDGIRWKTVQPKIRLILKIWNEDSGDWIIVLRPQSFLNEALLTRVALAIRIGALNSRLVQADFRVLCLDDMLISLDMSNRMQVLKWLLNPAEKPYKSYQIILLTHDRAFYQVTKHQIEAKELKDNWKFWELYSGASHKLEQPHLATGTSHMELAEKYYHAFDYAACANNLRKECESLIRNFLPENQSLEGGEGEPRGKLLAKLIDELKTLHKGFVKDFSPFANLNLYKDILMNPLSHDNFGTSVYQQELRELMDNLIPELQKLKSEMKFEIERGKPCFINLEISDSAGVVWFYKIELLEHLREFTFCNGSKSLTNPKCHVMERAVLNGMSQAINNTKTLNKVFNQISRFCGVPEPTDKLACLSKRI